MPSTQYDRIKEVHIGVIEGATKMGEHEIGLLADFFINLFGSLEDDPEFKKEVKRQLDNERRRERYAEKKAHQA